MDEGLSFSDVFDDSIPYEQKPPQMLRPMEEDDFPIQAKDEFGGLWEENLLTETHLQDLYHATNESSLVRILQDNSLKLAFAGGTSADELYNRGYPYYLSTMRAKYGNYARGFGGKFNDLPGLYDVVIHLDGNAIKNAGFKTFPIDYWSAGPERSEQEERIVSDNPEMKPLSKFIKDIQVYIRKDLQHPKIIDSIHQASKLAPERGIKIYFYPPEAGNYFQAHRTEKAVTDVSLILKPAVYTQDDLEYMAMRKAHIEKFGERNRVEDLEALIRIYNGDYSKTEISGSWDERTLRLLRYYPHDAYASLMATVHNYKKEHLPIFREIVAAMKKEGVKNFKDLIKILIDREQKRAQAEREIREAILIESADRFNEVEYILRPGNRVRTDWKNAHGIFTLYNDTMVAMKDLRNRYHFYSTDPEIEKYINRPDFQQYVQDKDNTKTWMKDKFQMTHTRLRMYAEHAFGKKHPHEYISLSRKGTLSGRVWIYPEISIVGFWQDIDQVRKHLKEVVWALHKLDVDEKNAVYTFENKFRDHYTYADIMGTTRPQKANPQELELQKLIHLNPKVKRGMLKLGSNRLQHYADKLEIPLIKLKHLLGSMDENSVKGDT